MLRVAWVPQVQTAPPPPPELIRTLLLWRHLRACLEHARLARCACPCPRCSQLPLPWAVNCTVVQPGSCRLLLTVGDDPAAHVYEASSGRQVGRGREGLGGGHGCRLVHTAVSAACMGLVRGRHWSGFESMCAAAPLHDRMCCRIAWRAERAPELANSSPCTPQPVCSQVAQLKGHEDYSFAAAWHPDGNVVATGNQVWLGIYSVFVEFVRC